MPVHNEVETIEKTITEFHEEIGSRIPIKFLILEDGSTDGTKDVLMKLSKKIKMVAILSEKRKGYSKALVEGLRKVDTKFVLCVDSDGQHLANDFWKLYEFKDYDVVSGWRIRRADPYHRRVMSAVFQFLTKVFFKLPPIHDITAPYRLMKSEVAKIIAEEFKYMRESFWTEFTVRTFRKGYSIIEIPVNHRIRAEGSTRVYKLSKIPRIALSQLISLLKLWLELRKPIK
jgi:glycosyltransferase involved in cell wall biosynthesis